MDPINVGGVAVALIAAGGAWASQRAAAKATVTNASVASRVEMEKEAYDRARAYDTETIRRQERELEELRAENQRLETEVKRLRLRVERLERNFPHTLEEILRGRLEQPDSDDQEQ